jgi:protein gp37
MNKTGIAWTDYTWNPVSGCSKVSEGCKFCYAEAVTKRFFKGVDFKDVICHEDRLKQPLGVKGPAMVFVNSMSDLFHEEIPFSFIDKVFDVMEKCKTLIFQILTKRHERMYEYYKHRLDHIIEQGHGSIDNIWFGVTTENQESADKRIPTLLKIPAKVRFLSAEPLLGPLDIRKYKGIDWVICGAESGPHARPMDIKWAYELRDQCKEMGIAFFMKQICEKGRPIPYENFPEELKIREYPR